MGRQGTGRQAEDRQIQVEVVSQERAPKSHPLERAVFELDSQLDALACTADEADYLLAIASGALCAALDVLWVGEIDLSRGREVGSDQVERIVIALAQATGCEKDDLQSCVRHLERAFPLAADDAMNELGGPTKHHLRDFSHHASPTGLVFSIVSQFTGLAFGTDKDGCFTAVPLSEEAQARLYDDPVEKVVRGTLDWFGHLASDMAGSGATAGTTGGTGIPGPIVSLAEELAATPLFKDLEVNGMGASELVDRLFDGRPLAAAGQGAEGAGAGTRMDLRGELGIGDELARQAIPVLANECLVRVFYLLHQLVLVASRGRVRSLEDLVALDPWDLSPASSPTMARLVAVASAVFTSVDVADAALAATARGGQTFWLRVNYPGVGHFCIAMERECAWQLRRRDLARIRTMYQTMERHIFDEQDNRILARMGKDAQEVTGMGDAQPRTGKELATADMGRFGLTLEQTQILYNLERLKTMNDIARTSAPVGAAGARALKREWLREWEDLIERNFPAFTGVRGARITWCDGEAGLVRRIEAAAPEGTWFRLVLLEAMLFEPYFALSAEEPKKYRDLRSPLTGYKESEGDRYLHVTFEGTPYYPHDKRNPDYIRRLRRCYDKVLDELSETLAARLKGVGVAAAIALVAVGAAGLFAGSIAVALVGSSFAGLNGAALTSACLAYLGGGAIAAGGAGMAGGVATIVGGGAVLGLGAGAAAGAGVAAASVQDKEQTILQSAKLIVAVREIFLNDEGDVAYSTTVYEQYTKNIMTIEADIVELELRADEAAAKKDGKEERRLRKEVKDAKESVEAMKRARKSLGRFISSYETGTDAQGKA